RHGNGTRRGCRARPRASSSGAPPVPATVPSTRFALRSTTISTRPARWRPSTRPPPGARVFRRRVRFSASRCDDAAEPRLLTGGRGRRVVQDSASVVEAQRGYGQLYTVAKTILTQIFKFGWRVKVEGLH